MDERTIVCTVCPMGCNINIKVSGDEIISMEGNECPRGKDYARDEYFCPTRTLTSSVLIEGSNEPLLPVRTEKPVPKDKIDECMKVIKETKVTAPIKMYQMIIPDLAGTGVGLIAACPREAKI